MELIFKEEKYIHVQGEQGKNLLLIDMTSTKGGYKSREIL